MSRDFRDGILITLAVFGMIFCIAFNEHESAKVKNERNLYKEVLIGIATMPKGDVIDSADWVQQKCWNAVNEGESWQSEDHQKK